MTTVNYCQALKCSEKPRHAVPRRPGHRRGRQPPHQPLHPAQPVKHLAKRSPVPRPQSANPANRAARSGGSAPPVMLWNARARP